jgi:acetyl-CoA acetyltransferase
MKFTKAFLPAGGYWCSPFCKWQGAFAELHPLHLAADFTRKGLARAGIPIEEIEEIVLGTTIPSKNVFYGPPWLAGLIGAPKITGATISQACATSTAALAHAAARVELAAARDVLVVLTDKCSNGPHVVYPSPSAPGGTAGSENWVMDSFERDPWAGGSMIQTAENVAKEAGFSREAQDAITVHRYQQYHKNRETKFYERYMIAPYEVNPSGKKVLATVEFDEGVFPTSAEGLAKLRPVVEGGTVTFGTQTHPADGNAGLVVGTFERAKTWSRDGGTPVQILSYGQARVEKARMAKAVVPAARKALASAGIGIGDVTVIKTHNPFAVNDLYFARELEIAAESFNDYGSSLVYGHPQGPTAARAIIEGIEQARELGGGFVLFAGCAAGDTAAAMVLKV